MTTVRVETAAGKRKLSDEHRAKLSERSRAAYESKTPEERAAQVARIGRKPKPAAGASSSDPGPAAGGAGGDPPERRSPLAMTPLELVRSIRGRR